MFSEYLVAFILLLLFFYYKKRSRQSLKNVPGPRPNFIFGNLLDAIAPPYKQLSILSGYIDKYGKTIKLEIGPFKEVLLTADPKLIEFLLSSTKIVDKATQYKAAEKWLGNSVFAVTASNWRKQRRMLTPAFHLSVLIRYIDIFESLGDILLKRLENEVDKNVDIYPFMTLCTLDVICEAAMGTSVNAQTGHGSEFVNCLEAITDLMVARTLIPLPDWLYPLTPMYYKEKRMLKTYHSYTEAVIDRRIESLKNVDSDEGSFETKKRLNFLDLLLKIKVDGKPLNKTEIREQVDTFMFGGQDTTSSGLTFALYSLAQHPDIQKKVYEEQLRIFGKNKTPDMTIKELQDMKYLENVIKESLRMYPPGPIIARQTDEELEWKGMTFPKGTDIVVYIYGIHKNPDIYPEPDQFKPERFDEDADRYRYSHIPFSAGPRNCIGKMFAMLEMKSIISKIVRNFEIYPSNTHELKLVPKVVLTPYDGCYVRFKKRI